MSRWIGALVLTAAIVLSAGPDSADASETFVGRVAGSNAYIAVSKDGRRVGGYVCDNGSGSRWIGYTWLRNGRAPLRAGSGERVGSVRIAGRRATGTIRVRGRTRRFRATRVRRGRDAGLHFALGKQTNRLLVAGWILLPDGTQRGAVSRLNMEALEPLETIRAPRLDPGASTIQIGGDTDVPPVETEPQELVVLNIIAILIGLLLPAVQAASERVEPVPAVAPAVHSGRAGP